MDELRQLARLPERGIFTAARWQPETSTVAVTVGAREDVASGVFHRLTGGLTSQRLEILAADIHTRRTQGLENKMPEVYEGMLSARQQFIEAMRDPAALESQARLIWDDISMAAARAYRTETVETGEPAVRGLTITRMTPGESPELLIRYHGRAG
jgi:hypothetical protein